MVTLSVVVPATDAPSTLARCRAAIDAADHVPHELLVIDGPASLTASEARNAGVERATGDVVVFVDADVVVHRDAFTRLHDAFAVEPGLTAVFGSYDDAPDHPGTVSRFRNLLHHHVHQEGAGPAETFWTGLGAVRRDALVAVGGFDGERYPHPSIEDIDLGARLHAAGGEVRLDPAIQGTHLKAWTLRSMVWTDFARRGIPWVALQLRTRRSSAALNLGWRHRVSALACVLGVVALALGRPLGAMAALAALVALNRSFYALLVRRLGPVRAVAGVALHGLHHLTAVAAVPAALVVVLAGSVRARRGGSVPTAVPDAAIDGSVA